MLDVLRRALLCGAALGALMAVDAGVAAAAGGEGTAKGRTAQGRVVRLRVDGDRLRLLSFTARLRCRDGSLLVDSESGFMPTALSRGGRFADRQFGSTDVVRFKGKVGKRAIQGRIRVSDRVGKVRCDSRWFGFSARFRR